MNSAFTLVIPTLNRFDLLVGALNSAHSSHPHRLAIIDNSRLGWSVAKSWNEGIKAAFGIHNSKYAIVSNDDVIYHKDCLDAMVETAEKGALLVACRHLSSPDDLSSEVTRGGFSLFLITRECVLRTGWFDEHFFPAYYEDGDYHWRMHLAGISDSLAEGAGFFHYGSQTINVNQETARFFSPKFEHNQRLYLAKWGNLPEGQKYEHPFNHPELHFRDTDYVINEP